jgi:hypothetical protein
MKDTLRGRSSANAILRNRIDFMGPWDENSFFSDLRCGFEVMALTGRLEMKRVWSASAEWGDSPSW